MLKYKKFFDCLPFVKLSHAAYVCKSYCRSIKYFERYAFKSLAKDKNSNCALLHNKRNDNDGRTLSLSAISAGQLKQRDVSFWQKIQSETKEIDGMIGISIFRMDTNIFEQALDFESNGRWDRALNCYEQILQRHANNIEYHQKYLKCLLCLGHFSAVISHVNGICGQRIIGSDHLNEDENDAAAPSALPTLTNMPTQALSTAIIPPMSSQTAPQPPPFDDFYIYSKSNNLLASTSENAKNLNNVCIDDELAVFGIESAWRLKRWDLLNSFIEKCSNTKMDSEFQCKLGECLSVLHSNPQFADVALTDRFDALLDDARLIAMKEISSCYVEGYHAVYPYLVQLQMLQELTHYKEDIFDEADDPENKLKISMFPNQLNVDVRYGDCRMLKTSEQQQAEYMNVNNSFFWNERLERTANTLSVREPILSLRRTLYSLQGLKQEEAFCWLQLAKEARANKQFSHANTALFYAQRMGEELTVPYIKWQAFLEKMQLVNVFNAGSIEGEGVEVPPCSACSDGAQNTEHPFSDLSEHRTNNSKQLAYFSNLPTKYYKNVMDSVKQISWLNKN